MKRKFKILASVIVITLVVATALTLVACSGSPDTFTFWMSPNSDVYKSYQNLELNPVIAYVENKFNIKFKFIMPAAGSEADQFTVLTTDPDCPDIMDLSYYSGGMYDLVEDGVAVDLTEYIYPTDGSKSYFPNYASVLDNDLNLKNSIRTLDNKYYSLATIDDVVRAPWGGYMYRKDLVLKYATAEDSFTLDGNTVNPATWTSEENIVFPSGATAPDLISDYDWMFKILYRAVAGGDLNYVMSLFYPGYIETGDMLSAWGVSGAWYKEVVNGQTTVKYGANTEGFKSYLIKMKEWYDLGYIDKDFSSRTGDQFFSIDSTSFAMGRIGCFYGYDTMLGSSLKGNPGVDDNIDLRACYMPRLTKDSEPISFYGGSQTNRNLMITSKVLDKDYEKLFAALDYLYGEEGSLMTRMGLNKEQYAELKADGVDFWDAEVTLTDAEQQVAGVSKATQKISDIGVYHYDESIGKYVYWNDMETNFEKTTYEQCLSAMSFWGMCAVSKFQYTKLSEARLEASYTIWSAYSNSGYIDLAIYSKKLSSSDNYDYIVNYNSLVDYMKMEVPKFIKGTYNFDKNWTTFCNNLVLRGCNKNTNYLQAVFNAMEGR